VADIYSFSRLDTASGCMRKYYYEYVEGNRGGENIYSFLGSAAHDIAEELDKHNITNEQAIELFKEAIQESDMLGFQWISEKVRANYIECVMHYFQTHVPPVIQNLHIEDYFGVEIAGIKLHGYIDKWYRENLKLYIDDYKTSSMFSGVDLEHKKIQLLTYALHLERYYPEYELHIRFNMMKYALQNGKLVERNKLKSGEFSDGIIDVPYTQENKQQAIAFIENTVKQTKEIDPERIYKWHRGYDPRKDFFCKWLCGHKEKCLVQ
jgi:hypothetical protein